MALTQQDRAGSGGDKGVRPDHDMRVDITKHPDVEIELTESEPTIQQQQAYQQFWKLFIERVMTKKQPNNNP
jgi:hypothetical protein